MERTLRRERDRAIMEEETLLAAYIKKWFCSHESEYLRYRPDSPRCSKQAESLGICRRCKCLSDDNEPHLNG